MNPVELIIKKRNGESLTTEEIRDFFTRYQNGSLPDYQMSAMLMAMYFNPLSNDELAALCHQMIHSGTVLDLSAIEKPKIDKHSTGGVGDKTSLILAPIVASLGIVVPMVSGRGLGHTGGTLDKLESIPGFSVGLTLSDFQKQLQTIDCGLIGQTRDMAPLDKSLYALRDVTGTVESIPLIAASIMSKKIASGLDGLVLDVKTGEGAFMKTLQQSQALAETLLSVAEAYRKPAVAFITDMNEPLGCGVGNWLEVKECLACLQGEQVEDLMEVSLTLAGAMIHLGGKADSTEEGKAMARTQITSGKAYEKFLDIVRAQHGDVHYLESPAHYPESKYSYELCATETGYITGIDAREVGFCAIMLGAGRQTMAESVDPKAGIVFEKKCGGFVKKGQSMLELYTDKAECLEKVTERLKAAITISSENIPIKPKVLEKIEQKLKN